MDSGASLFIVLFSLALAFQAGAIVARKLFLSLFFAFAYTLFISLALFAMGLPSLALLSLGLSCGFNYSSLILTALLIGSHKNPKPNRGLSFSLLFFVLIAIVCAYVIALLIWPQEEMPKMIAATEVHLSPQLWPHFETLFLVIATLAVAAFVATMLLLRRDDVSDTR